MNEIRNPFNDVPDFNCFGCAVKNKNGLKMTFREEEDSIIAFWKPETCYQGFQGILHGGIQATLLDEIASWVVFVKLSTAGVTREMKIKLKRPVNVSEPELKITGRIKHQKSRFAIIMTEIRNSNNEICTTGEIRYYLFSVEEAQRKLKYPGREFFNK